MLAKVVTAAVLAATVAGCAVPYSPTPIATNFPTSRQEKLQAAAHWNAIADHIEQRIVADMKKHPQRPYYVAEDKDATPFKRAVLSQLMTSLVKDGYVVSRTPAGAWKLDVDIQGVTFTKNRPQYRYSGAHSAIATGVWVLSDIDPTVGLVALAGASDAFHWFHSQFAPGATPKTELIVTLSVSDQFRYYARSTSAYYVADTDRELYGIKDEDAPLTRNFKVTGPLMRRAATILALALLGGCASTAPKEEANYATVSSNQFVEANYKAANVLLAQLNGKLAADKPLIMATVVNIDALDQTSTLGRLISEQISTRMAQGGLKMLEMKLRSSVYMKRNQGELMLTRELGEVAQNHDAQAVVVGSYAETSDMVFINVKVVQPQKNYVLAAHDYVLQKEGIVRSMLLQR